MMNLTRWILVIPLALAACFVAHLVALLAQSLVSGFEKTSEFWRATDMNGQWIAGTISILWVRGTSGALSTFVASRVAPHSPRLAGGIWFVFLAIAIASLIVFALSNGASGGAGFWYRSILEFAALLGGAALVLLDEGSDLPSSKHTDDRN